jgi:hypothetical protein
MKARAAWRKKESEPLGHCTACDPNRSLQRKKMRNALVEKEKRIEGYEHSGTGVVGE